MTSLTPPRRSPRRSLQQSLAALERITELEKLFQLRYEADQQRRRAAAAAALNDAAAFEPPDGADDYLEPADAAVPPRPAAPTQSSPAPPSRPPSAPYMSSVPLVPYVPKPAFDGTAPTPTPAVSTAANSAYYSQAPPPPSVAYPDVKPLGTMPQYACGTGARRAP